MELLSEPRFFRFNVKAARNGSYPSLAALYRKEISAHDANDSG